MTEPKPYPSPPPVPVTPLIYFDRQGESLIPFVNALSWMAMLVFGVHALTWVVQVVCYFAEISSRHRWSRWVRVDLIWTDLADALVCGVIFFAAIGCLRYRETSRYILVIACLVHCLVGPITYIAEWLPYGARINPVFDPAGAIAYLSRYALAAVQTVVIPGTLVRLFPRAEVRSLFR